MSVSRQRWLNLTSSVLARVALSTLLAGVVMLAMARPPHLAATGPDAPTANAVSPIPKFSATALNGKKVSSDQLIGQWTLLVVSPSKEAAGQTQAWADALAGRIDMNTIGVRNVIAIDLLFFMSESDAIGQAREKVPRRFYDDAWLLDSTVLENALGIPTDSAISHLLVLDAKGTITARVSGEPTASRIDAVSAAIDRSR